MSVIYALNHVLGGVFNFRRFGITTTMPRVLVSVLMLFAFSHSVISPSWAEQADERILESAETFFDISFGDLQEEMALAEEEGKSGILVMFETKDCPWCTRMKLQVLNRARVQEYFHEHFRIISIDAEGDVPVIDFEGNEMTSKEFALKSLRVRATPVFAFFDPSGKLITRYTGAVKNAHDFLLLGRYVAEGHHLNTKFNKYRRENQPS